MSNKLNLSPIVAGCWKMAEWNLPVKEREKYISHCLELGITSFDHADIYGDYRCEELFGEAFKAFKTQRSQLQIVSKCGIKLLSKNRPEHTIKHYDTSYSHIISSAENSLKNLGTDYLDCLLIHRPDPLMNAEEVARAFSDLIDSGKILSAGVSNFTPLQLETLQNQCDFQLATNQIEVSLTHSQSLQDDTINYCQMQSVSVMAWSPLGGGKLFDPMANQNLYKHLDSTAESLNASIAQVALAWLLMLPVQMHPIIGSGKLDRITEMSKAKDISLSRTQWFELLKAASGKDVA